MQITGLNALNWLLGAARIELPLVIIQASGLETIPFSLRIAWHIMLRNSIRHLGGLAGVI
jgi:hypothetical protein